MKGPALPLLLTVLGAVAAAFPQTNAPPSAEMSITVECVLIEMPPKQADMVQATLLRWNAYPAEQTDQLDRLLWGGGAKQLARWSGTAQSGVSDYIKASEARPPMPPGAKGTTQGAGKAVTQAASLNFMGFITPDLRTCGVTMSLENPHMRVDGSVAARNHLPLLVSRWDREGLAMLVVLRTEWPAPASVERPSGGAPVMPPVRYLRAELRTVPPALAGEAGKLQAGSAALAAWVKQHGSCRAALCLASWSDTQAALRAGGDPFRTTGSPTGAHDPSGFLSAVITPAVPGNAPVLRAASSFFLPISASGSPGQQASGRMFDATTEAPPATNGVVIGQAVAFRCIETMWRLAGTTRDDRAILSRAPATNAYVVFEIVRIPASAGLHFYNTN